MTTIRIFGDIEDPASQCEECDVVFFISWRRNGINDQVEFCPFCGAEVEETISELEWGDP